jgi:hypothetical protein
VISYYAAAALPRAGFIGEWVQLINEEVQRDVAAGRLPSHLAFTVQVSGDPRIALPGHRQ